MHNKDLFQHVSDLIDHEYPDGMIVPTAEELRDLQGGPLKNVGPATIDSLEGKYPGRVRGIANGQVVASIDPSASVSPVMDAFDLVAANGGGTVELPPESTIQEAGPIKPGGGVHLVPNNATIEITGGGDGLYIDTSNANASGGFVQFSIYGELSVHGPGDNAGGGYAVHMGPNGGLSNSQWVRVNLRHWDGVAWYEETGGAAYQNVYEHLHFSQVDAGDVNGVVDLQGGGAPDRVHLLSAYPSDSGSLSDSHILRTDPGSWHIGTMNIGGTAAQAIRANVAGGNGVTAEMINWEPTGQNSTPNAVVFANGGNPVKVGHVVVRGTTSYVYGQWAAADNYFGTVNTHGTGSVTTNIVENRNDTNGANIYEGLSADVTDNSGVALTTPIACLGDLTTVS